MFVPFAGSLAAKAAVDKKANHHLATPPRISKISFSPSTFLFFRTSAADYSSPEGSSRFQSPHVIAVTCQNSATYRMKASAIPNGRLPFLFSTLTLRRDFTAFPQGLSGKN